MVLAIVHPDDADRVNQTLVEAGYGATRMNAQGGFLRRGNAVFMVGVPSDQVDDVIDIVRRNCEQPAGEGQGGSVYGILFVLQVSSHARL